MGVKSQLPIHGTLLMTKGQALELYVNCEEVHAYVSLGEVQEAKNKPLGEADVRERMKKTGESPFYFESLEISMDNDIFVPNGGLNQIRRDALAQLEEAMLVEYRRNIDGLRLEERTNVELRGNDSCDKSNNMRILEKEVQKNRWNEKKVICSCETRPQFETILKREFVTTIYVDTQMYTNTTIMDELGADIESAHKNGKEIFLRMPVIFRGHTSKKFQECKDKLQTLGLDGVVIRNYEELSFIKTECANIPVVVDHNLYTYNDYAKQAFAEFDVLRDTIPLELNQKEIRCRDNHNSEMVVYGYYPLMNTAGCVHKNTLNCDKRSGITYLKDRYNVLFPVKNYCQDCYNVIYNSVPVMLFAEQERLESYGVSHVRLDFSIEKVKEVENVLDLYEGKGTKIEYTNGHYKRGVE